MRKIDFSKNANFAIFFFQLSSFSLIFFYFLYLFHQNPFLLSNFFRFLGFWWFISQIVPGPISRFWARFLGTTMKDLRSCAMIAFVTFLTNWHWEHYDLYDLKILCFTYGYIASQHLHFKSKAIAWFFILGSNIPFMTCWWYLAHVKAPISNFDTVVCLALYVFGAIMYCCQFEPVPPGYRVPGSAVSEQRRASRSSSPRKSK